MSAGKGIVEVVLGGKGGRKGTGGNGGIGRRTYHGGQAGGAGDGGWRDGQTGAGCGDRLRIFSLHIGWKRNRFDDVAVGIPGLDPAGRHGFPGGKKATLLALSST